MHHATLPVSTFWNLFHFRAAKFKEPSTPSKYYRDSIYRLPKDLEVN